jgi:hypothetical protein
VNKLLIRNRQNYFDKLETNKTGQSDLRVKSVCQLCRFGKVLLVLLVLSMVSLLVLQFGFVGFAGFGCQFCYFAWRLMSASAPAGLAASMSRLWFVRLSVCRLCLSALSVFLAPESGVEAGLCLSV